MADLPPPSLPALTTTPSFRPAAREVDNWRHEAALALDLAPEAALALAAGDEPRALARCVRLNNYWCIKRAGWTGEIAADGEGHVAFASAREGAAVAALLLRRYYVSFGLKTARAIVSRWAPAQCGMSLAQARGPRPLSAGLRGGLARRGLGGTLRARWLATHTIGGVTRGQVVRAANRPARVAAAPRRSSVPDRVGPLLATPAIMAGFGAPAAAPVRLAMLPYAGLAMGPAPGGRQASLPPLSSCSSDGARIANYAAKASDGVVANPDIDLALFDAEGRPTPNLARVMSNMAAVEIGPLRASDSLVAAGVAAIGARPN